jgi:hypothetical protein
MNSQAIKKAKWQVLVVVRSGLVARPRPPVSAGGRTGAARNSELGRGHAHAVGTALLELELEFLGLRPTVTSTKLEISSSGIQPHCHC